MSKLPKPPAEVPACRDVNVLAPAFLAKWMRVEARMRARGWDPVVLETRRTNERQAFLFGFGRQYDDDRGIVTNVPTALKGWHFFCLALDCGQRHHEDGTAPHQFYLDLEHDAMAEGLTSGADWNRNGIADEHLCDAPHVQWFCEGMHVTPSDHAADLLRTGGLEAVWHALGADKV